MPLIVRYGIRSRRAHHGSRSLHGETHSRTRTVWPSELPAVRHDARDPAGGSDTSKRALVARVSGLRAHVAGHEDRPARRCRSTASFFLVKVPIGRLQGTAVVLRRSERVSVGCSAGTSRLGWRIDDQLEVQLGHLRVCGRPARSQKRGRDERSDDDRSHRFALLWVP